MDGRLLVDARFEAQQRDAVATRMPCQVIDQPFAVCATTELRPHVHALDLAVFLPDEHDAAAPGGPAVDAQDEKRHTLGDQLVHAEAVAALGRVERLEVRLQLVEECGGVGRVGPFGSDGHGHGRRSSVVIRFVYNALGWGMTGRSVLSPARSRGASHTNANRPMSTTMPTCRNASPQPTRDMPPARSRIHPIM